MAFSFPEIKQLRGLYLQRNSFTVPDGAFEILDDGILSKDSVVSKRRGFYEYYSPGSSTQVGSALYRGTLLALFTDKIGTLANAGTSPNYTGTLSTLSGETVAIVNRKPRTAEANDNFFFTTDNGVLKLESTTSSIYKAGVPPGLDLKGKFIAANGGIEGDSQVYYRIVFGRQDSNNNVLLGAPSDFLPLTNAPVTASWARVTNVVTITTSSAHGLATGMVISVTGCDGANPVVAGDYTVTVTAPTTYTIASTAADSSGTAFVYKTTRTTRLESSIPSEITTTGYFYRIYRSTASNSATAAPNIDLKLVDQVDISASDISRGFLLYEDDLIEDFLSTELYTNPNSQEGESQANTRPPLCKDIALFKGMMIYANATTRHQRQIDLVSTSGSVLANADYIEIKRGSTTRRYLARTGVGNDTVRATAAGVTTITISYSSHGFLNGDTVYVSSITGTLAEGAYVVSGVAAGTFDVTGTAGATCTACDVQGVKNASNYYLFKLVAPTSSVAEALRETAIHLAKAVNRDPTSVVYGRYISSPEDIPGKLRFEAKGFGEAFSFLANTTTSATAFSPILPTSFSTGTQVSSSADNLQNAFFASKVGEPEAVPAVNFFPAGSRSKAILRAVALRDSLILVKEDGIFRVDGDSPQNLISTALDTTVFCVAEDSVATINNQVGLLSNQGVCLVSSSSVQIISRDIEDPIAAILGSSVVSAQTSAASYESERLYLLSTIKPGSTTTDITYCYNTLSEGWSTWTTIFKSAAIGPNNTLYYSHATDGKLYKERKNYTRIDYCGQNYSSTVVSVASDKLSAVVTVSITPEVGDALVLNDVFSRVSSVTASGSDWILGFRKQTSLAASNTPILYKKYKTKLKPSPFHAGAVGRNKQFSAMQLHLRDNSVTSLTISFVNAFFGGSEQVFWESYLVSGSSGWGRFPWGMEPWGNPEGIASKYATDQAPIVRVLVPIQQQRGTYIQPIIEHDCAGEAINLQAIAYAVRGYGERTTR